MALIPVEASPELLRQVQLRGIGGIVVIEHERRVDFATDVGLAGFLCRLQVPVALARW